MKKSDRKALVITVCIFPVLGLVGLTLLGIVGKLPVKPPFQTRD